MARSVLDLSGGRPWCPSGSGLDWNVCGVRDKGDKWFWIVRTLSGKGVKGDSSLEGPGSGVGAGDEQCRVEGF